MNHPPASIDKIQKEISLLQQKLTKSSLYEESELRNKLQYLEDLLKRKNSNSLEIEPLINEENTK